MEREDYFKAEMQQEPQAEMMPLIERKFGEPPINPSYKLGYEHGTVDQWAADMAWHNEEVQQVRRAARSEMAGQVIAKFHWLLDNKHIQELLAMAGKE